jgi:hypothetical protein
LSLLGDKLIDGDSGAIGAWIKNVEPAEVEREAELDSEPTQSIKDLQLT